MMKTCWVRLVSLMFLLGVLCVLVGRATADVTINLLAVNGTDTEKVKEIYSPLPDGITGKDVLDAAGLKLEFNVAEGIFYVTGKVTLKPKETRTFQIRIRDVWKIVPKDVDDIKMQVDTSVQRLKDSEFAEVSQIKRATLLKKLDAVVKQQETNADNVKTRLEQYKKITEELNKVRYDAFSVDYWKKTLPPPEERNIYRLVVTLENPSDTKPQKVSKQYYLPPEINPEHIVSLQGFDLGYDPMKGQPYLFKEEDLKAGESKRYEFEIVDVWTIAQSDIDDIKLRAGDTFKLLDKTEYAESAQYLVASIKENIEVIEASQAEDKNIDDHISSYRINAELFERVKRDVDSLENLLKAARQDLERSRVKDVLQRIKSLRSIRDLSKSIFKRPAINTAWKIIAGVIIFVGLFTIGHFTIWARRSREKKLKELPEEKSGGGKPV